MIKTISAVLLAIGVSGAAHAATYNFDVTWGGASLTETSVGSGLSSTTLNVGDEFTLTIRAAGDGFWTALSGAGSSFYPLNPRSSGATTGDVSATLSNDGSTVFVDSSIDRRCCAELGFTRWEGLQTGTVFDTVVMEFELLDGAPRTIFTNGTSTTSFWSGSIFSSPAYSYTDVPAPVVPLPAAGWLLLAGVGGLAAMKHRKSA